MCMRACVCVCMRACVYVHMIVHIYICMCVYAVYGVRVFMWSFSGQFF